MCCLSRKAHVSKFLKEHKNDKMIEVYKILFYSSGKLYAPFRQTLYQPGEHDFRCSEFVRMYREKRTKRDHAVSYGFHCYLDRKTAHRALYSKNCVIVKCYVDPKDVIGVEGKHAVFCRAFFREEDFNNAILLKRKEMKE